MRVVLLGPPGAGKGTQADRIAARFQLVHVATGDILRTNVADGTSLGEVAQAYLDSGELVPDQVVVAMMLERLTRPDCAHGSLLDYYGGQGLLFSVAAAGTLDDVTERILHAPRDVPSPAPPAHSQPATSG